MKKVVKCGGSSLASAEQFKKVGDIVRSDKSRKYVVPSAPGKRFGADTKVEEIGQTEKVKDIRKRAIQAGLKLVDCPIRHLGTEKAQEIYLAIEKFLQEKGVEILFGYNCCDVILEDGAC